MYPKRQMKYPTWSSCPTWLRVLTVIALVNFFSFVAMAIWKGGDALNGYRKDGKFYLGNKGVYHEVTPEFWWYSYWHLSSVMVTHGAIFIGAIIFMNHPRYRSLREGNR